MTTTFTQHVLFEFLTAQTHPDTFLANFLYNLYDIAYL